MEQNRLGKADRLTNKSLHTRTQGQVLPFNLLRVWVANGMLFRLSVSLIYFCPIGVNVMNPNGWQ